MVLVVQVRSSVMCTPRNLVLLTLSTVELSMVSGGWSTECSPEVHHNLLCLLHIEGQIVGATPFRQLCHFLSVVRSSLLLMRPTTVVSSANLMMWWS